MLCGPKCPADVIHFGRTWKGCYAHRICLHPVVEYPDELQPILLIIQNGFIEHDQQIAVWQRQAIVRAAAKWRRPVAVGD
jgi:hypothetical protein